MLFGKNTARDISKLSQIEITYNNFEISLVVFMPNMTTNHAITYTNFLHPLRVFLRIFCDFAEFHPHSAFGRFIRDFAN